jgi:hypothetical protein
MFVRSTSKISCGTARNGYEAGLVEFQPLPLRRHPDAAKSGTCPRALHIRTNYIWKTIMAITGRGNPGRTWRRLVIALFLQQLDETLCDPDVSRAP